MKSFVVLALLAGGVLTSSLRLWDCPLCGGAVRRKRAEAADCPRCLDAGRVSAWTRALRARPDPRVRALLERSPSFVDALKALSPGERPAVPGQVRFAVRDGEDVVVALLSPASSIPGRQTAEAWMFSLGGAMIDHMEASRSTREGGVGFAFGDRGSELWILTGSGSEGLTLRQRGGPPTVIRPDPDRLAYRSCRLRFGGAGFERIPP